MSENVFPAPQALARPVDLATIFVGILLLALLILMIGIVAGVAGTELAMLATSLVMLIASVTPFALTRAVPVERRHILLSLWAMGMGVYFALPVFTQYFFLTEPVDGITRIRNIQPEDILNGQLTALLALSCAYIGYFYPVGRFVAQVLPGPKVDWSHNATLMVALVMIPAGWFVTIGGQLGLIPSRLGSGALGSIGTASYMGLGLLTIMMLKYRSRPALLLALLLLVPTMLFAFLTGSKRFVLSPVMCIALGYFVCVRRIQLRWVVLGAISLVMLYPIATFYREFVLRGYSVGLGDVITNPGRIIFLLSSFLASANFSEYLEAGIASSTSRLDALGILTVIVRDTPDIVPFQGGWTIGYVFVSFIPRIIWAGKPSIGIGQWVTDNYGSEGMITSNTGSTWVGELFFNFGFAGVVIGMLIIGMYFRILHETLFRSMTVPAMFASIVVLWATCTTIEMNLIAPFNGTIFTLVPVLVAHIAVRTLSQPNRPIGGPQSPVLQQTSQPPGEPL